MNSSGVVDRSSVMRIYLFSYESTNQPHRMHWFQFDLVNVVRLIDCNYQLNQFKDSILDTRDELLIYKS